LYYHKEKSCEKSEKTIIYKLKKQNICREIKLQEIVELHENNTQQLVENVVENIVEKHVKNMIDIGLK
jgi:hypothetical protein